MSQHQRSLMLLATLLSSNAIHGHLVTMTLGYCPHHKIWLRKSWMVSKGWLFHCTRAQQELVHTCILKRLRYIWYNPYTWSLLHSFTLASSICSSMKFSLWGFINRVSASWYMFMNNLVCSSDSLYWSFCWWAVFI